MEKVNAEMKQKMDKNDQKQSEVESQMKVVEEKNANLMKENETLNTLVQALQAQIERLSQESFSQTTHLN